MKTSTHDPGELIAVLRVYNDVTDRLKRSHDALAAEVHRLHLELGEKDQELQRRERLAALGQMAAGVAHEIRNPLSGIGIYASILQRELADQPEHRKIAGQIHAGVQNVEKIIRDILEFAGGGPRRCEPVLLRTVIHAVAAGVQRQVEESGAALHVDSRLQGVRIRGDAGRIERALFNLVANALEAAGPAGQVWLRAGAADEGSVSIIVEDDGPGIQPGSLHKIFNPFFTTKDTGTGLGLAIVHSIAESHGGYVKAGSRQGGGASFVLTLPAAEQGNGRWEEALASSARESQEPM